MGMWSIMQPVFEDLVKNPPSDPALCPCVKDAQKNGVIDELHDMIRDKGSALIVTPMLNTRKVKLKCSTPNRFKTTGWMSRGRNWSEPMMTRSRWTLTAPPCSSTAN